MKTMTISELKSHFSEALKKIRAGQEINVTYGKKKEVIAKLVPITVEQKSRRKIGVLEGKVKIKFATDFAVTEEYFLNQ